MIKVEEEKIILQMPDTKHIVCLKCKWGQVNYLEISCAKYPTCKPKEVYYENAECEKFEKVK